MDTAGEMIRVYRQKKRMTQKDVADAMRVTEATVSRWENDENPPSRRRLQDLINLLDLPRDDFVQAIGVPAVPQGAGKIRPSLLRYVAQLSPDAQEDLERFVRRFGRLTGE